MVDFSNALPLPIRKAALRVAGFTEAPFCGCVGQTEEGYKRLLRKTRRIRYPRDPRLRSWSDILFAAEDREATPEEIAHKFEDQRRNLEKHGLVFAEPSDPEGFTVKWKSRPAVEWDEETMKEARHA